MQTQTSTKATTQSKHNYGRNETVDVHFRLGDKTRVISDAKVVD